MSSSLSPLTLHAFPTSPNPLKVSIALELLKLPYDIKIWQFGDDPEKGVKSANFAELSENGRVPVLEDPNTSITAWESGSILNYLRRTYDKDSSVLGPRARDGSCTATEQDIIDFETWELLLLTTLGPMTGQVAWFRYYHPTKNDDALDRYVKQVYRCYDILETQLKKSDGKSVMPYGITAADCHWYPWVRQPDFLGLPQEGYPLIQKWVKDLDGRKEFKRAYDRLQEAAAEAGTANADESGKILGADAGLLKAIGEGTV